MKRAALLLLSFALIANDEAEPEAREAEHQSEFVGRYDGSSFETAMGMEIRADHTFGWGVSVGALDLHAKGTWMQDGPRVFFTSDPKPVEPVFRFSGIELAEGEPFVRVVWGKSGEEFQYASARITCRNGKNIYGQVHRDGYPSSLELEYEDDLSPDQNLREACDVPETVTLTMSIYDIRSKQFDLADLGWKPGETARFEFHRNDMGVADFTGVSGYLEDGVLKLQGAKWPLEMRKLPPRE